MIKIKSHFAILDVMTGRGKLMRHYGPKDPHPRFPVIIEGYITGIFGNDDGVSREFIVEVKSATLGKPEGQP